MNATYSYFPDSGCWAPTCKILEYDEDYVHAECVQYCILEYGRYYSFLNKKDREIGNYNTVC